MRHGVWVTAEHDFAGFEDRLHQRDGQKIVFARRCERDIRGRGDAYVVTFSDVVDRHESVE
jgi:hypothetical protein